MVGFGWRGDLGGVELRPRRQWRVNNAVFSPQGADWIGGLRGPSRSSTEKEAMNITI